MEPSKSGNEHEHDFMYLTHVDVDDDGSIFELMRCECGEEMYVLDEVVVDEN